MGKSVFFPSKYTSGYYDPALRRHFSSKDEKREFLKKHKLVENQDIESERHRTKRLVEEYNADQARRGKKEHSSEHIVGDTHARKHITKYFYMGPSKRR